MNLLGPRTCCMCKKEVEFHELRQCSNCGTKGGEPQFHCIRICKKCRTKDCTLPCHLTCWEGHLPRDEEAWSLHVEVDPLPDLYVDAVTYSERNTKSHRKLHQDDQVARWFVVRKDSTGGGVPRLLVTDRFRQQCDPGISNNRWSSKQFPGFVSFIGDTGVGKSTLLRAMILMGHVEGGRGIDGLGSILATGGYGPVTRSSDIDRLTDPTSFGVHLYRDDTAITVSQGEENETNGNRETPILFLDCEGFRAGVATTNAERAEPTDEGHLTNFISDLPITAAGYGSGGKDGVDLFYARFLYTISDVVVFVVKSDTSFQREMQRLVEWAASAVHRAVNHLAHKTLIIVRNKADLHDTDLYDEASLKDRLFKNLGHLWDDSRILKQFRDEFNAKHHSDTLKIHSNDDLLDKFFSERRVCYLPDKSKELAGPMFRRYQALRKQVVDASRSSQTRRWKAWMQYNVPMWSHILNRAFEHFRTLDKPFDFYTAARNDNPNPISVSDHIANFLRHLHLTTGCPPSMFSQIVSISLVRWSLRTFGPVQEPDEMFKRELKGWCESGLDKFSKKDQTCGFQIEGGGPCINRRLTHNYEHCDTLGNRVPGTFDESQKMSPDTVDDINGSFVEHFQVLCADSHGYIAIPSSEISRQYRERFLQKFTIQWKTIRSNKTCFACLQAVPDHILKCGHSYCSQCVQEFGNPSIYFEYGWTVDQCVLCQESWQEHGHLFRLQPKCAGVRALTLDGGGIRGIVELVLLGRLESAIGLEIPLRDYFDIMVGTSTGGIIALGFATLKLSTKELKQEFVSLATKTFRNGRALDFLQWTTKLLLLLRVWDSVYPTEPLMEGLKSLLGADRNLFSPADRPVRVAVTSTKDNGANRCLITNYNRPEFGLDHDFEREDENDKEMKIWEAALATAAAPFYFPKFEKPETKKDYVDGALHANFPVPYALEEIARIWPGLDGEKPPLDILLSVGTGIQEKEIVIPTALRIGGFEQICINFHNNLDSERNWEQFELGRANNSDVRGKIYRLNARIGDKRYVALDDYKKMQEIDDAVTAQLNKPQFSSKVEDIAAILVANLFFFEPTVLVRKGIPPGQTEHLAGSIRCRLARESKELKNLVNMVESFWYTAVGDGTSIPPRDQWTRVPLTDEQRNKVRTQRDWFKVECTIASVETESHNIHQVLAVTLRRKHVDPGTPATVDVPIPISGFPVSFLNLKKKARLR